MSVPPLERFAKALNEAVNDTGSPPAAALTGDKPGRWQTWYRAAIPLADARFAEHLAALLRYCFTRRQGRDPHSSRAPFPMWPNRLMIMVGSARLATGQLRRTGPPPIAVCPSSSVRHRHWQVSLRGGAFALR